ncbi:MAG: NAD(P)-binding domain-containing protein [Acidimicrobiales bacterium]
MESTTTIIIGAGPAGLAMSRSLTDLGIDHVVLERGEVGNSWKTERWDSLRLLTPNWMTRLPGFKYNGEDPDGYMTMPEVGQFFDNYADTFDAPIETNTTVKSVTQSNTGYTVETDRGTWDCTAVVVATGACSTPRIPDYASELPSSIVQLAPTQYRNPEQLPSGGVLVVGASASGLQLADEIRRSGREVTLAVGTHTRLPRHYRGRDMQWWLDATGTLDARYDEVGDLERARREPSLQLVGSTDHHTLDLGILQDSGVRLAGHLGSIDNGVATFADDLGHSVAKADARMERLLDKIDSWAFINQLTDLPPVARDPKIDVPAGLERLDLEAEGIETVIWATGFKPHYPWLQIPVKNEDGGLIHDGGVLPTPGAYVLGLPFMRRRKSTFIDGAGPDATELAQHLAQHVEAVTPALAVAS